MFSQLSYCVFFILFNLVSISECTVPCSDDKITCGTYPNTWCCSNYERCGSATSSCYYRTTTTPSLKSSDISSSVIALIIIVPLFLFLTCLSCCLRSQQRRPVRSTMIYPNAHTVTYPYQQQTFQGLPRVVHGRPVYNVSAASPIHNVYEAPPPSYEAATNYLSPKYTSTPPPSVTATVEQTNSRF